MPEGRHLINSPPSCPGKACFDFTHSCTSRCCDASCVKPHPTNNCSLPEALDPIWISSWPMGAWDKTSIWGPKCRTSRSRTPPSPQPAEAKWQLCGTFRGHIVEKYPPCCKRGCGGQPQERGSSCCPRLPSPRCQGEPPRCVTGWRGRHRPPRPHHLPGFKVRQVGLEDLGD